MRITATIITFNEADLTAPTGPFACGVQQKRRDVDPDYVTLRSNPIGELQHGLSRSAPNVYDHIAGARTQSFDRPEPKRRELSIQRFTDLSPSLSRENFCWSRQSNGLVNLRLGRLERQQDGVIKSGLCRCSLLRGVGCGLCGQFHAAQLDDCSSYGSGRPDVRGGDGAEVAAPRSSVEA